MYSKKTVTYKPISKQAYCSRYKESIVKNKPLPYCLFDKCIGCVHRKKVKVMTYISTP